MGRYVNFKGNALTLVGRPLEEGVNAPDFKVVANDLSEVTLADFKDKVKVIHSFPSLDTPVCDLQVKEFNKRATQMSGEVVVLGISKDLPFAQKRFCDMNDIKNVLVLSDYKTSSFGINYGLLIKELNLLARAALILDKSNVVRYFQLAGEITSPLNHEEVLQKLTEVIKESALPVKGQALEHCKPCEGGIAPLDKNTVEKLLAKHRGWELIEGGKIRKDFKFKDFLEAKLFVDLISVISEDQGHHPTITVVYNKVKITLTTHAVGGLTDNDFIMAKIIDEIHPA